MSRYVVKLNEEKWEVIDCIRKVAIRKYPRIFLHNALMYADALNLIIVD